MKRITTRNRGITPQDIELDNSINMREEFECGERNLSEEEIDKYSELIYEAIGDTELSYNKIYEFDILKELDDCNKESIDKVMDKLPFSHKYKFSYHKDYGLRFNISIQNKDN